MPVLESLSFTARPASSSDSVQRCRLDLVAKLEEEIASYKHMRDVRIGWVCPTMENPYACPEVPFLHCHA